MVMHWKSAKGYINVKQMKDSHLANAWSTILRKLEDNSRLPKSLVEQAGLDMYDDEPLHELALGFQIEWERRLKERALAREEAAYPRKRHPDHTHHSQPHTDRDHDHWPSEEYTSVGYHSRNY